MELTTKQLKRVEDFLNTKDITYVDIRMEVFDHIVSDIEAKMITDNLDFETVFYDVAEKWHKHLKHDSSFYFGIIYSLPKIVLVKAEKSFKKWFFLSFLTFLIPLFLTDKIEFIFSETIEKGLNLFCQVITVLIFIIFAFLFILKLKENKKTTYSFILKTQSWNLVLGFIILFDYNYLNNQGTINVFQVSLLIFFIFSTYIYFHFYKKHKEVINKYKIS
mgnify:CR=1 FL=1